MASPGLPSSTRLIAGGIVWRPAREVAGGGECVRWSPNGLAPPGRRLMLSSRLIVFDKRGTGLSDRPPHSDAGQWVEDTRPVFGAAGSTDAVVLGMSMGGAVGTLF